MSDVIVANRFLWSYDTQHNDIQQNDIQQNDIQQNDIQLNSK